MAKGFGSGKAIAKTQAKTSEEVEQLEERVAELESELSYLGDEVDYLEHRLDVLELAIKELLESRDVEEDDPVGDAIVT